MTPRELIDPDSYRVRRLGPGEVPLAKRLFSRMTEVFEEDHDELSDGYVEALLARAETWVLAALLDLDATMAWQSSGRSFFVLRAIAFERRRSTSASIA